MNLARKVTKFIEFAKVNPTPIAIAVVVGLFLVWWFFPDLASGTGTTEEEKEKEEEKKKKIPKFKISVGADFSQAKYSEKRGFISFLNEQIQKNRWDVYLIHKCSSEAKEDAEEKEVMEYWDLTLMFNYIPAHKKMFCGTWDGRASMVRQLQPHLHLEENDHVCSQLDGNKIKTLVKWEDADQAAAECAKYFDLYTKLMENPLTENDLPSTNPTRR